MQITACCNHKVASSTAVLTLTLTLEAAAKPQNTFIPQQLSAETKSSFHSSTMFTLMFCEWLSVTISS